MNPGRCSGSGMTRRHDCRGDRGLRRRGRTTRAASFDRRRRHRVARCVSVSDSHERFEPRAPLRAELVPATLLPARRGPCERTSSDDDGQRQADHEEGCDCQIHAAQGARRRGRNVLAASCRGGSIATSYLPGVLRPDRASGRAVAPSGMDACFRVLGYMPGFQRRRTDAARSK
jgi:hypothetical protein